MVISITLQDATSPSASCSTLQGTTPQAIHAVLSWLAAGTDVTCCGCTLLLLLAEEDELMGLDVSKHGERAIAVDHTFVNSSVHNGSAHGGLFGVQAPAKAAVVDKAEAA